MGGLVEPRAIGTSLQRIDGAAKATGTAPYAYEQPVTDPLYLHAVQAGIARGRVTAIDTATAEALPGVAAVLTHYNAPRLASDQDRELWVLQSSEVAFRGQFVAAVIAETSEIARHAAELVKVSYLELSHDSELRAHRDGFHTGTADGDVDTALASAAVRIDQTYTTPMEHNNPMEPHTTVAVWESIGGTDRLTLYDSTQGVFKVRHVLAPVFGLDPQRIRVVAPYVGGGFGSKGMPHAHNVLAGLAAQVVPGRPVKYALTRQQMFALAGYRSPTIQRIALGADADGRLSVIAHDVIEQTSRIKEYVEDSAAPTRMMYAAPNRRTTRRLERLDVAVPFWMRAPGVAPGMFAGECAMDELAIACGLDPIELRVRNEPATDPETGNPWSGRHLIACLHEGARRFGWHHRDPTPGIRRQGCWLVGSGVAAATYPHHAWPGSTATVSFRHGRYLVRIGAVDIGTGSWTALTQIAADALTCPVGSVELELGDTDLPTATIAAGSSGITSWGTTIVETARTFRDKYGPDPSDGDEVQATMPDNPDADHYAMHSFGAQFAEVRINADTGEIRVSRMLGVFSLGRVINPRTTRSQLLGGMTMGLSMALHEQSIVDHRFGHVINHDLAGYHIATHADVADMDASWLDEHDPHSNPMGSRGAGEIGIVGAAAAIANAVHHATGIRIRDLPITADKLQR
ncbi:MAG TPA: xanthine dehydrogenase family protein molybdopterin-binding subunit [Pseudonocardiaceae bacterium]|jgi:xanthine dehydrogenase YagR molybdenum-binding subunit|nr:xanthine dehydrogenase family protein molybdopterin-binding subunit [Pseudonocardiaceae bacterium]